MRRRELITLLGGAAVAWPLAAQAQQAEQMRRIGVLMNTGADEPESQARLAAFMQGLQEIGWAAGRNLRIDYRWSPGDLARLRNDAAELVALRPEVILAGVGATTMALQQVTRTIPIVMAQGIDPVGNGYIDSLARPGGNTTGFIQFEYSLADKWMELLKEVAPGTTRVGVLREPGVPAAAIGQWTMIQGVAQSLGAELKPIDLRDANEIERAVTAFARFPNAGLIVVVSAASLTHRELIITLAARHRLPTVYPSRVFVTYGGLIAYRHRQPIPTRGRLCRSHPQGRESGRFARAGADQVRDSSSTSKPRRHSASNCRRRCSPAPTRSSNEKGATGRERDETSPQTVSASGRGRSGADGGLTDCTRTGLADEADQSDCAVWRGKRSRCNSTAGL
jgi:putative tryptophan/tyrosine transport system substrate-binding protein